MRSLQGDEAIPMGEVSHEWFQAQAPPSAADSSHPSTWDVETVTVHQAVEDVNDGREMGIMSSNNVSPAASSGLESPGQPGPSSGVSDDGVSDDASDGASDKILNAFSWHMTDSGSSPSSSHRSEDYTLDKVIATSERLLETGLSNFDTYPEEVKEVLHFLIEARNLCIILAFDFSNRQRVVQEPSSGNLNLHASTETQSNSIEEAVTILGKFITEDFFTEVKCFGYGDVTTHDEDVFSFSGDQQHCNGSEEILRSYRNFAQHGKKGQSISLVPIIHTAMDIVDSSGGQHHILIIFTEHSNQAEVEAVIHASFYALSIVVVGVGDGPWDKMQRSIANLPPPCDCCICRKDVIKDPVDFRCNHTLCEKCLQGMYDSEGPGELQCPQCRKPLEGFGSESSRRRFLNCHFVDFNKIMQTNHPREIKEATFVLECFKETSKQCKAIQYLGILGKTTGTEQHNKPLGPPVGCNAELLSWDDCYEDLPEIPVLTMWPSLESVEPPEHSARELGVEAAAERGRATETSVGHTRRRSWP